MSEQLPDVRTTVVAEDPPPAEPEAGEGTRGKGKGGKGKGGGVRHAARFQFFTGALVFIAVASVALAFVFAATSATTSSDTESEWSSFKPSSDGIETGAREIADHVGRQYRLPSGEQIVVVTGGPMQLQDLPLRIVMRESVADGGDVRVLEGTGVLYRMCGLGPKCAIEKGEPTAERALLLHREALELALYSFHDLDDVDHVVVFMPPKKGEEPSIALHFGRDDVAGQLVRPLRATLPSPVPNPDTITTAPNTPAVRQLTAFNIFTFSLTESNRDASAFLVLDPPPTDS